MPDRRIIKAVKEQADSQKIIRTKRGDVRAVIISHLLGFPAIRRRLYKMIILEDNIK